MGRFSKKINQCKLLLFLVLALVSLLLTVNVSWGWGAAFGQTAGPTPTDNSSNNQNSSAALTAMLSADSNNPTPESFFNYTLTIQNSGSQTLTQITAIDTLPGLLSVGKISDTATITGQEVTIQIGTLKPSQSVNVTINVQVRNSSPINSELTNSVTVQGRSGDLVVSNSSNAVTLKIGVGNQMQNNQFLGGWGPDLLIILVVIFGLVIFMLYRRRRTSH